MDNYIIDNVANACFDPVFVFSVFSCGQKCIHPIPDAGTFCRQYMQRNRNKADATPPPHSMPSSSSLANTCNETETKQTPSFKRSETCRDFVRLHYILFPMKDCPIRRVRFSWQRCIRLFGSAPRFTRCRQNGKRRHRPQHCRCLGQAQPCALQAAPISGWASF